MKSNEGEKEKEGERERKEKGNEGRQFRGRDIETRG